MELKAIETPNGVYEYEERSCETNRYLNQEVAKKNLLDFREILLNKHQLKFGLIGGTLLGAVREKGFIKHDYDTDLFVLVEQQEQLFSTFFDLRDAGFELGRVEEDLISFFRDDEYIDVYLYKKSGRYRAFNEYIIKAHFLENLVEYPFLGETFYVPEQPENLLVDLYGLNWNIPDPTIKESFNARPSLKAKRFIRKYFYPLFALLSWTKHKVTLTA